MYYKQADYLREVQFSVGIAKSAVHKMSFRSRSTSWLLTAHDEDVLLMFASEASYFWALALCEFLAYVYEVELDHVDDYSDGNKELGKTYLCVATT